MKFRDKIKSKVNTNSSSSGSKANKHQISTFDETMVELIVLQPKQAKVTQLEPIELECKWIDSSYKFPDPTLKCTWFIRTQDSIEMIEGVAKQKYQPSLEDIGKTIEVQCVPECQGLEYEGMPFKKTFGPITLDPDTEEEATDLLEAGKATFFVEFKEISIESIPQKQSRIIEQGLIKIIDNTQFQLFGKKSLVSGNELIFESEVSLQYPQVVTNRKDTEIAKLLLSKNGDENVWILLSNNKIRDSFCLLISKIRERSNFKNQIEGEGKFTKQLEKETKKQEDKTEATAIEKKGSINSRILLLSAIKEQQKQQKVKQQQQLKKIEVERLNEGLQDQKSQPQSKKDQTVQKSQQQNFQTRTQNQLPQTVEPQVKSQEVKIVEKVQTKIQQNAVEEFIGEKNSSSSHEVRSRKNSEDFSNSIERNDLQPQSFDQEEFADKVGSTAEKSQAQEQSQISQNKQEDQRVPQEQPEQTVISQNARQKDEELKSQQSPKKIASVQYLSQEVQVKLQSEVAKVSENRQNSQDFEKLEQQLCYYKNQQRLLLINNSELKRQLGSQEQTISRLQKQLEKFVPKIQKNSSDNCLLPTYQQLQQKLESANKQAEQFENQYRYAKEEKDAYEEEQKRLREEIEEILSEKNHLQKKYQSLANQRGMNNGSSRILKSMLSSPQKSEISQASYDRPSQEFISLKSIPSYDQKLYQSQKYGEQSSEKSSKEEGQDFSSIEQENPQNIFGMDFELNSLRKQVQELTDENNELRSLAVKSQKDKKVFGTSGSSKTQLKLEILELKKLANRLAESLTQKELSIANMKALNKALNQKVVEMAKQTGQKSLEIKAFVNDDEEIPKTKFVNEHSLGNGQKKYLTEDNLEATNSQSFRSPQNRKRKP